MNSHLLWRVFRRILFIAAIILSLGLMGWLAAGGETWESAFQYKGRQLDYYNQLLRGLDRGHLYIPITRDIFPHAQFPHGDNNGVFPDRASAPLDTSFYHGRIYVYYGVVPVVVALWPYHALTGSDLSLNIPTLFFTAAGFLVFLGCFVRLRKRWFPRASSLIDFCAVLVFAFGSGTTFLVRRSMFYELPLATGYFFLGVLLASLAMALTGARKRMFWIALASLSVGLATGCHPNYVFLTPLVALVGWWLWRDTEIADAENSPSRATCLPWVLAAVLPAAIVGAALAWYNYARFGNPFEFGFNYGANEFFATKDALRSPAFIWPNLKWYYFSPPSFSPYFPFCFPVNASFRPEGYHGIEAIHGQFFATILFIWIVFGIIWIWGKQAKIEQKRFAIVLGWAGLCSAGFILIMGIRANRYLVDFQAPLILLAILGAGAISHVARDNKFRRGWHVGLFVAAFSLAVVSVLSSIQQFDIFLFTRPKTFDLLSRALNPSWAFWQRFGLVKNGGVLDFDITFRQPQQAVYEPLITTGVPLYSDCIYAAQHPNGYLQFFLDHGGHGGPRGHMIRYETGKKYHVQIELGSFYPPRTDPLYATWDKQSISKVKTKLKVSLDGVPMLEQHFAFAESAPWRRLVGANPLTATLFSTSFSGKIENVTWSSDRDIDTRADSADDRAFLKLQLTFPAYATDVGQPVLMAGDAGAGALLLLQPLGKDRWRWGMDVWSVEFISGPEVTLKPGPHEIEIIIGPALEFDPQVARIGLQQKSTSLRDDLVVWVDGTMIYKFPLHRFQSDFRHAKIGSNTAGFSTADVQFYGDVDTQKSTDSEVKEKILEALK